MNDLLAFAIEAHGGLRRWNAFNTLRAELSVDGAIWHLKQQPNLLKNKVFEIDTHAERLSITPFDGACHRSMFVPDRLTLETIDGSIGILSDESPRNARDNTPQPKPKLEED